MDQEMSMLPDFEGGAAALRRYRRVERPSAYIGFLLLFVGVRFFFDHGAAEKASAVGHATTGAVPTLWSLCFIVGGAGLIYGTQRPDPRIERAALILLAAAITVNAAAILVIAHRLVAFAAVIPHALLVALFVERIRVLTWLDKRAARRMGLRR